MYKNSAVEQDALDCWAVEGYQQLLMDVLLERSQKEQALLGLFDSPGVYGPDEVSWDDGTQEGEKLWTLSTWSPNNVERGWVCSVLPEVQDDLLILSSV